MDLIQKKVLKHVNCLKKLVLIHFRVPDHYPLYFTKKLSGEWEIVEYTTQLIDSVDVLVIVIGGFNNMLYELLNNTNIEFLSIYMPFVS